MSDRSGIALFAGLMLAFIYAMLVFMMLLATPDRSPESFYLDFLLLAGGFAIALFGAAYRILRGLKEYTQDLHDIDSQDAWELVSHLLFGLQRIVPGAYSSKSTLRVQAGKADIGASPIVHKVGGPMRIAVFHDSAVVTSRLGILNRVLGPGFYILEPFERVWSVVDLRTQRRTLTVEFMTRDGIPASCQATIVCRVAGPAPSSSGEDAAPAMSHGVAADKIVQVAQSQIVRKLEGSDRVSDWVTGLSVGVLDGEVRDVLEQYKLDELFDPAGAISEQEDPSQSSPRKFAPDLERLIQSSVRQIGRDWGVLVERVELGAVRPIETAVPAEWISFWRSNSQRHIAKHQILKSEDLIDKAQQEQITAQVQFVEGMLNEVQELQKQGRRIPPQLVLAGFMEVVNSMYDQGPQAQQLLLWQADSLVSAIDKLQRDHSMFARSFHNVGYRLPPLE